MWAIVSDNLTAASILRMCEKQSEFDDYKSDYSFKQYLYALVLWDAIYRSPSRGSRRIYDDILLENANQDPFLQNVANTIKELPFEYCYFDLRTVLSQIYSEVHIAECDKFAANGALFYLALGQITNMNIMLSQYRAEFVQSSGISNKLWSRKYILEYVDKEVFEIYRNLYSFFGQNMVHLQTPLLVDYICQNATCFRDAFNIALQLRETTEMIQFRETMNCIDDAFNEGNLLLINSLKQQLSDIIKQFTEKEIPTDKATISLSLTPSFTLPTLSAELGIPIGCDGSPKHRINLNFITNLVQHGLTKAYRNNWSN